MPERLDQLRRLQEVAGKVDDLASRADVRDARREFDRVRRDLLIERGIADLQLSDARHAADLIEVERADSDAARFGVAAKIAMRVA
jgi:hypothetical protein